jgi:protein-tyrosine-phosphatase
MQDQQFHKSDPMSSTLESIVGRLATKYHGVFSPETVARAVDDAWDRLTEHATVLPPFFPALVERFAKDQLRAAAQVEGLAPKTVPEVLFVCEHNAGRSQMAAALAHHLGGDRLGVRCAGSHPGERIYPVVIEAMSEVGLDVTHEFPKPLTDIVVRAADVVVTMGCGEACPVYPGKHYEDWDVGDPEGQPIEQVRSIRDELDKHVHELLTDLLPDSATAGTRHSVGSA